MNIGVYITTLKPSGASQERMQDEIFRGLIGLGSQKYRFIIFSLDTVILTVADGFTHIPLSPSSHGQQVTLLPFKSFLRAILRRCLSKLLRIARRVASPVEANSQGIYPPNSPEAILDASIRELNIRIMYHMNQHWLKCSIPSIRTVWDVNHRIHSYYPEYSYTRGTFDVLDKDFQISLAKACYIITGTQTGKRQLMDIYGVHHKKIRVIPFPAPILAAQPISSTSFILPTRPFILYPARFWPHKNHITVVEALSILRIKYGVNIDCVFTGADEGNLSFILQRAVELGVRDLIDYRGKVSDAELSCLYLSALCMVYASAVGPDNLPPLEAMVLECPVITANVDGANEQYGDGVDYFSPFDSNQLADKIHNVLKSPGESHAIAMRGKLRVQNMTAQNYALAVLDILDEFNLVAKSWQRCDSRFS